MINFDQLIERENSVSFYTPYGFSQSHTIIDFIQHDYQSQEVYNLIKNIIEYVDYNLHIHQDTIMDIHIYIAQYIRKQEPKLHIQWKQHYESNDCILQFHTFEIYSKQDCRTLVTINLTQINCTLNRT